MKTGDPFSVFFDIKGKTVKMTDFEILQNAEYLLELALCKANNFDDAQDLVQETMLAGIRAVQEGSDVQNTKAFLTGILNHKFTDKLRQKYSKPVLFYGFLPDFQSEEKSAEDVIVDKEEEENIRRSLSELSKIYREVLVKHFIHGKSVKQIAAELNINENTVKSRLNSARQTVKQRMEKLEMEKFEQQSYEPKKLDIWVYGEIDEKNPFDVNDDKHLIHQNILLLAYEKPVTVTELSQALGISTAYIEPIVQELIDDDFMKRVGDKVYTSFIIYKNEDIVEIVEKDKAVARENYRELWADIEKVFEEIKAQEFFKKYSKSQKEAFLHFNAVFILQQIARELKARKFGTLDVMELHHESGWYGYAFGHEEKTDEKIDWSEKGQVLFQMNGPHGVIAGPGSYKNLEQLMFLAYEVNSGRTFGAFSKLSDMEMLKIMYSVYSGNEDDIPLINQKFFQDEVMEKVCSARLFERTENKSADKNAAAGSENRLTLGIPVLEKEAWEWWDSLLEKTVPALSGKYSEKLEPLYETGVKLPKHLKDVPEYMRYQENATHFTMAVIFYAQWNGLYLTGRDFQKDPIPAMIMMCK